MQLHTTPNAPPSQEPSSYQRPLSFPFLPADTHLSQPMAINTPEQVKAWKQVTDAVHDKGSFIFCQLWALGRAARPHVLANECGVPLVSASPIPLSHRPTPIPHALTDLEIKTYIDDYTSAARNAIKAGFDGIELHAANGYLIDQFLQDVSNQREDDWGGSIENRARFAIEIVDSVVKEIGSDRVAVRLSPWSSFQDMGSPDPIPQFSYLVHQFCKHDLAYLHVIEPRISGSTDVDPPPESSNDVLRQIWQKKDKNAVFIVAGGYTRETAIDTVQEKGGMIAFGRLYICNPDLPIRLVQNLPLTKPCRATFYLIGDLTEKGYVDYPPAHVHVKGHL